LHPPTYDLGTNLRFAKEVGLVRNLFDENQYFAGGYHPDLQTGPDACNFDCDIQVLANIKDCAAGSVLCLTVLEHVIDPQAAVRQIYRILKPGGVAVISVPFFISYHGKSETHTLTPQLKRRAVDVDSGHDSYGDFWRFTHEGLCVLFANAGFSVVNVYPVDGPLISRLQVLGLYRIIENLPLLNSLVARMDRPRLGKMTTMHFVRATK
jgi:SAM-dependent methyltransferase